MKQTTAWEANDGKVFATEDECRAHEMADPVAALTGRTAEEISAALTRADIILADAIERIARMIAKQRVASGDLRRQRQSKKRPPIAPAVQQAAA